MCLATEGRMVEVQNRSCQQRFHTPGLNLVRCRSRQFSFFKKSSVPCHFSVNIYSKRGAWTFQKKRKVKSVISHGVEWSAAGLDWSGLQIPSPTLFPLYDSYSFYEVLHFRDPTLSCRPWPFSCVYKILSQKSLSLIALKRRESWSWISWKYSSGSD